MADSGWTQTAMATESTTTERHDVVWLRCAAHFRRWTKQIETNRCTVAADASPDSRCLIQSCEPLSELGGFRMNGPATMHTESTAARSSGDGFLRFHTSQKMKVPS